jgi:hypothetical protein
VLPRVLRPALMEAAMEGTEERTAPGALINVHDSDSVKDTKLVEYKYIYNASINYLCHISSTFNRISPTVAKFLRLCCQSRCAMSHDENFTTRNPSVII